MFRIASSSCSRRLGFPRVRGDVPSAQVLTKFVAEFSPRARGCSTFTSAMNPITKVFPACAGMFPPHPTPTPLCRRFPRVRGDVPCSAKVRSHSAMFSPRARGCSGFLFSVDVDADVFPACAGMFPDNFSTPPPSYRFPRVRGDVPGVTDSVVDKIKFSPRARGCSAARIRVLPGCGVFPACAGMFPAGTALRLNPCRFPRVRGDVPTPPPTLCLGTRFSPRARGCSADTPLIPLPTSVFPACAGMFPLLPAYHYDFHCFPRVRGDVPNALARQQQARLFSPRARGCSLHDDHPFCVCVVFPACAGMFLPRRGLGLSGSGFPRVRGDVPVTGLPTRLSALFSPRARGCS